MEVVDRRHKYDGKPKAKSTTHYAPLNDRVLLRRVAEERSDSLVQLAEAYQPQSNKGEVVAVGDGMLIGGELRPIPLQVGDLVLFGQYNAEEILLDEEEFVLVSAFDIRLKWVK